VHRASVSMIVESDHHGHASLLRPESSYAVKSRLGNAHESLMSTVLNYLGLPK
jgi:hypothetical protein